MNLKIYQPFITSEQLKHIPPISTKWDASKNTAPNQREYELFQKLSEVHQNDHDLHWGLVSWKFDVKTPISLNEFHAFAQEKIQEGHDCVFINPMIANEAMFASVWEQASLAGHKGMDEIVDFLSKRVPSIYNLQGKKSFAFCNYFVGNRKFWDEYFKFSEPVLQELESEAKKNSPIGRAYAGSAHYGRDSSITMRPFIAERLFSTLLAGKPNFSAAPFPYQLSHYVKKFGEPLGDLVHKVSNLKNQAFDKNDRTQQMLWDATRKKLRSGIGGYALGLDDVSDLLLDKTLQGL